MLPSTHTQLHITADALRPGMRLAAWNAIMSAPVAYFYGYWFSHWRA
jgi:hypothetical protein